MWVFFTATWLFTSDIISYTTLMASCTLSQVMSSTRIVAYWDCQNGNMFRWLLLLLLLYFFSIFRQKQYVILQNKCTKQKKAKMKWNKLFKLKKFLSKA